MVSHGSAHACSRMPSAPRPDLSLARERVRELPASVLGELGPAALSSSPLVLRGPSRVGGMDGERGDAGPGGVAGEGGEARGLLVPRTIARQCECSYGPQWQRGSESQASGSRMPLCSQCSSLALPQARHGAQCGTAALDEIPTREFMEGSHYPLD